jgi:hypothetical protein
MCLGKTCRDAQDCSVTVTGFHRRAVAFRPAQNCNWGTLGRIAGLGNSDNEPPQLAAPIQPADPLYFAASASLPRARMPRSLPTATY